MTNQTNAVEATDDLDFDLEAMLSIESLESMDADDEISLDVSEEIIIDMDEVAEELDAIAVAEDIDQELDDESLATLGVEVAKEEAYAEQEVLEVLGTEDDAPSLDDSPAKEAKVKKEPRKSMAGSKKSDVIRDKLKEILVLEVSDGGLTQAELEEKQDTLLDFIDKEMAIKVGEKAVNLIAAVTSGAKLSAYTAITLRFLVKQEEGITVKQLIEHMENQVENGVKGYSNGTANSQSHQMFKLLPALKITKQVGKVMMINEESLLMDVLREVI